MIRNVILDWSGTVVDDLAPVVEATNRIFRHYGKDGFSLDEFRRHFRLPFSGFYDEFLPEASPEDLEPLYHEFFQSIQHQVTLLPGARDFLDHCRATGRRIFLLSTIRKDHFQEQATRLGVMEYFEVPYVEIMDKREVIVEMQTRHDLRAEETVFVGDMVHDIETARHGNVLGIATLTGFDHLEKLASARPDLIVQDLGQLKRMLPPLPELPASSCSSAMWERPVATVGAAIFDTADRVLMLRTNKWSGKWGIPGGKIERGESSIAALRRELREETALEVGEIEFVMVQDCIDSMEFQHPAHFLLLNYTVRVLDDAADVVLNDEAEEFQWLPLDEALDLDLNIPTRTLLEEVTRRRTDQTHG